MRMEALRYIESNTKSYWEVRTEEGISQYNSLRSFGDTAEISLLARQAICQSGRWLQISRNETAIIQSNLQASGSHSSAIAS